MITIVNSIIIAVILAALLIVFAKPVHKWRYIVYLAVLLITAYIVGAPQYMTNTGWPQWFSRDIATLFRVGSLAAAVFIVVMYIGILPRKWRFTKKIRSIRAELSVIACILALGHNVTYTSVFIQFFGNLDTPSALRGYWWYACLFSLILIGLMIPLLITSFYSVRKWMSAKTWKRLQSTSYIFYVMLYLHVTGILLYTALNGGHGGADGDTLVVYSALFLPYFVLRPAKYLWDRSKKTTTSENEETESV
ncbi:MAG: ferric reductase-like transmembrane domain-containing protein [Candidatus Methanoplasma sp.]|jgi:DMSO/TMAO reductase YedYZ heme-binding membrane subunit|nr:ferric reductase-like transmembrane domain-containing protein [Candidatus Methanoplasma sp.]